MIEPEVTAVLGRRFLAFLIDSSLVAATGLGVAFQSSTAFTVVGRDAADNALVDPDEFQAIEELLDFELFGQSEILGFPVVRAQEIGDSYRVFGADSYQSGLLAALVAALVLFGLVPMILQRTLGMIPFGLGIRSAEGTRAGIGAHVKRTIVGFVDAIPFALPGLLGFLVAKGGKHRQRFGDRVAKTAVVDIKALRDIGIAGERVDLDLKPERTADLSSIDAPDIPAPATATPTAPPSEAVLADAAEALSAVAETSPPPPIDAAARIAEAQAKAAPDDGRKPPTAKPTFGDPLPPPPVHRKPVSEHPLGTPSDRSVDTSAIAKADHGTEFEAAPEFEAAAQFEAATEAEAPTATAAEHLVAQQPLPLDIDDTETTPPGDLEVPDGAWQPPREEPAPVWQPTTLETAPIESPDSLDGRTIDELERIDPSIGALLAEPTGDETNDSSRGGKHSQKDSSAKTPVWSDKWRAWMYWDAEKKCWLRHDTTTNTWKSVT